MNAKLSPIEVVSTRLNQWTKDCETSEAIDLKALAVIVQDANALIQQGTIDETELAQFRKFVEDIVYVLEEQKALVLKQLTQLNQSSAAHQAYGDTMQLTPSPKTGN